MSDTFKAVENSTKREWNCRILRDGSVDVFHIGEGWYCAVDPDNFENVMILSPSQFAARFTVPAVSVGERVGKSFCEWYFDGAIETVTQSDMEKQISLMVDAALAERPKTPVWRMRGK